MSSSPLSSPPADLDDWEPSRRPSSPLLRRAARERQLASAADAAENVAAVRRVVPCLGCLNSALAGEKDKRRIAVKVVLAGIAAGTFPSAGDPRLA
ncbi:hypothetical protein FGRA07_11825 [Fusarium graminearum]|nr:hypothetical protein FGRA07_11825 [Fusarium graminearum]